MSTTSESARTTVCKRLRWKGMFIDAPRDPLLDQGNDPFCWCTHTMNCLGPDGKVARTEDCQPDRPCYERL